jgi:NADPH-dependent 2,4-dienoyl-CoA reductase/sulfur reductase-like enzyme
MSAAAKAKRENRELEVVVYEQGSFISYAACGMPYLIAGDVPDYRALVVRTPEQMARQGVQVHLHHKVRAIDPDAKTVQVRDLQGGRAFVKNYDQLVIATGACAAQPLLQGSDGAGAPPRGVLALRSLKSGLAIQRFLAERKPRRALVIGGGYIALEMAETFRRLGLDVSLLIRSGKVLRATIDDDVRPLVEEELARHDVEILKGQPLGFEGNPDLEAVVTTEGTVACDLVLLGVGAEPNVDLARKAGIATGRTGAIATDSRMRTNHPDVYAAGDCAEALHLVTGKPAYIPLGSTANKQGRVAGTNAAGGEASFGGVVGTMVVRVFDLIVASTGLTAAEGQAAGFVVEETKIQAKNISHYFPGASDIYVKLVTQAQDSRLLGGQIVGAGGVAKRIDVLATALYSSMTVTDLQRLDLSYAPPYAPVWDPILVAANVAAK